MVPLATPVVSQVGQLVVPQQGVAADQLAVLLGEGDQAVAAGPVVGALGRLDDLPLHLVAGGHGGELVAGDLGVRRRVQVERDDGGSDAQADRGGQGPQRVRRRTELGLDVAPAGVAPPSTRQRDDRARGDQHSGSSHTRISFGTSTFVVASADRGHGSDHSGHGVEFSKVSDACRKYRPPNPRAIG